ncbi:uncharacterized protein BDR25DRAFT_348628 [Lindgomyces ingoldianus]|uniref:Uncharacterized protein n=1 Tax=Lindgomyces ingoldianus TaxID=673940 RepID=A0ACB6RJ66_9PLEO|nr:uncharacterized protein BDR25DRAFT_348628 [Lindgomyces ingoldianus]KAF2478372.1 hypothetical protein BDR25DRAFT_348628 [Lindgomyces ingoldianus]
MLSLSLFLELCAFWLALRSERRVHRLAMHFANVFACSHFNPATSASRTQVLSFTRLSMWKNNNAPTSCVSFSKAHRLNVQGYMLPSGSGKVDTTYFMLSAKCDLASSCHYLHHSNRPYELQRMSPSSIVELAADVGELSIFKHSAGVKAINWTKNCQLSAVPYPFLLLPCALYAREHGACASHVVERLFPSLYWQSITLVLSNTDLQTGRRHSAVSYKDGFWMLKGSFLYRSFAGNGVADVCKSPSISTTWSEGETCLHTRLIRYSAKLSCFRHPYWRNSAAAIHAYHGIISPYVVQHSTRKFDMERALFVGFISCSLNSRFERYSALVFGLIQIGLLAAVSSSMDGSSVLQYAPDLRGTYGLDNLLVLHHLSLLSWAAPLVSAISTVSTVLDFVYLTIQGRLPDYRVFLYITIPSLLSSTVSCWRAYEHKSAGGNNRGFVRFLILLAISNAISALSQFSKLIPAFFCGVRLFIKWAWTQMRSHHLTSTNTEGVVRLDILGEADSIPALFPYTTLDVLSTIIVLIGDAPVTPRLTPLTLPVGLNEPMAEGVA